VRARTPARVHSPDGVAIRLSVRASQDSAVGKIGAGDDILDAIENDRPGGRKQRFPHELSVRRASQMARIETRTFKQQFRLSVVRVSGQRAM